MGILRQTVSPPGQLPSVEPDEWQNAFRQVTERLHALLCSSRSALQHGKSVSVQKLLGSLGEILDHCRAKAGTREPQMAAHEPAPEPKSEAKPKAAAARPTAKRPKGNAKPKGDSEGKPEHEYRKVEVPNNPPEERYAVYEGKQALSFHATAGAMEEAYAAALLAKQTPADAPRFIGRGYSSNGTSPRKTQCCSPPGDAGGPHAALLNTAC